MNFKGPAVRLSAEDFARCLAVMPGVEEAALRAVIAVETGGSGFTRDGRPDALFEPHLFWAELGPGKERDEAAAKGLAYQHWIPGHYPTSSAGVYVQIDAACAIDEDKALRSSSWGLGQILGRECREAGFPDATSMVLAFREGEGAQLMGMIRLIKARGLDKALAEFPKPDACQRFALAYNGSGYRRNQYDTKLAAAYAHLKAGGSPNGPDEAIRVVQGMLGRLGLYSGAADGINGPITQEAVKAFQRRGDLVVDGIAGPATKQALAKAAGELTGGKVAPALAKTPTPSPPPPAAPAKPAPGPAADPPPYTMHPGGKAAGGASIGVLAGVLASVGDPAHAWQLLIGLAAIGVVGALAWHHFISPKPKGP